MGKRAKLCGWRGVIGHHVTCNGTGRICHATRGRHYTRKGWRRVVRVARKRANGRHDWAWNEAVLPW